jgi:VWFA-related protein
LRESSASARRPCLGLVSLLISAVTASGSQRSPTQVFPSAVDLVVVDVSVVDADGRPVEKLTQNDFVIRENGSRQTVVSFAAVVAGEVATAAADRPSDGGPPSSLAEVPSGRTMAVILDDLSLTSFEAERAKTAVADFLKHHTKPGDEVSLIAPGSDVAESALMPDGSDRLMATLTRVRGRVVADLSPQRVSEAEAARIHRQQDAQTEDQVVRRFVAEDVGRALRESEIRPLVRAQAALVYNEAFVRTKTTLAAIERVVGSLGRKTGRKQVILASAGFLRDSTMPELRGIVNAALCVNAAIYFLDARGLRGLAPFQDLVTGAATAPRDLNAALFEGSEATGGADSLAIDTGGFTIRNTNDLAKGFGAIADSSRAYYLIGYHPLAPRHDGKFQRIEVRLEPPRRGMKVIARRGYFAPTAEQAAAQTPREGRDEMARPPVAEPSPRPAMLASANRYRQGDRDPAREAWPVERLRRDLTDLKRWQRRSSACRECEDRREFEAFPFEAAAMLLTERDVEERDATAGFEETPSLPVPLLDAARQIIELIPDPDRRRRFERPWLLAVALHLFQRGQWPLAVRYVELGLQRYPDDPRLLLARGSFLETQGTWGLKAASSANPLDASEGRRDAVAKQAAASRAEVAEAESSYRRALAADPGLLEARVRLGHVLVSMGKPKKAVPELEGVIAEPDADARVRYLAWLFLGAIREAEGRPKDAVQAYQAAIDLLPDGQAAYVGLSHAFHRLGERAASLAPLRGSLERAGRRRDLDPWSVYPWGQSHEVDGRLEALRREAVR